MRDVVVIMAKKPVPGAVKTRLAARVGAAAACDLYRAFLRDLHGSLQRGAWRLVWAVHPPDCDVAEDLGSPVECLGQRGADLSSRMHACFDDLFAGGAARVVMLGADAPHAAAHGVAAAFTALGGGADAVLQPTRDGGYCLVGLLRPHDLFSGVPMGTDAVLARTRARAAALRLTVELLPPTFDVDEPEDLDELRLLIESGAVSLPHTAAALRSLHP
jgi:rSAM/selenodomain-associated transferase 1